MAQRKLTIYVWNKTSTKLPIQKRSETIKEDGNMKTTGGKCIAKRFKTLAYEDVLKKKAIVTQEKTARINNWSPR